MDTALDPRRFATPARSVFDMWPGIGEASLLSIAAVRRLVQSEF
jgi:hypothetical protein